MSAPHMQAAVGGWVFVFYGICCFLTLVFTFVFIPETRGTPIESMAKLFGGPSRYCQWRQKKAWPPHGIPPPVTDDVVPESPQLGEKAEIDYLERV
ncbi:unnamed protein product [Cutaneotrichosporon oleaginosum]